MFALLAVAWSQDIVKYESVGAAEHGKGLTSITFAPQVDGTYGFSIDCGVRAWQHPSGRLSAGAKVKLELSGLPKGVHDCAGTIDVSPDEGQTGQLSFRAPFASLDALNWTATAEDVDLQGRSARATTSRPLREAQARIVGTEGQLLAEVPVDLTDPVRPHIAWGPTDEVLNIRIEGTDVHGFRSELSLSPWSYAIPHDDVVFDSGQDAVLEREAHKLESTWADIERVLGKYGNIVDIELFVAGYTDTVGPAASNQGLSERRARSIAAWFRKRGFKGAIHYQGFGESVLAVGTPDETDEQRNRRALYLLAASTPRTSDALPRADWRRLP
jgi:outer membrane protein OmpA-like peptidoglycan-associated protein